MGLQQTQNILANLYTNKSFREDFFKDPERLGNDFKLNSEEINELVKLQKDIDFFAKSLITKRREEVKKILPLILNYLKEKEFNEFFLDFTTNFTPKGIKKHLEDAYCFLVFLEKKAIELSISNIKYRFLKEIIKYEKIHVNRLYLKEKFKVYFLKYKIDDLEKKINDNNYELKLKPTVFLFIEFGNFYKSFYM